MQIGQYETTREVGRGGMGVVYEATQPSLNRVVALKVLPEYSEHDTEAVERFRREGRIAASLRHANIVQVYEASLERSPYYIAMEFLGGGTLEQRLRKRPPQTAREVLVILSHVCNALDHAHPHIVHRDIKPGNIMFDAQGRAVLMDFGIVRDARQEGTIDGSKFITPCYISPEQAISVNNPNARVTPDYRSDLYSLAVVAYELLVGRPPFMGDMYAVMNAVMTQPPPPPSKARLGLPKSLDKVFAKALAKRPEQRYQSAREFLAAVRQAVPANLTLPVKTAPPEKRSSRSVKTHKVSVPKPPVAERSSVGLGQRLRALDRRVVVLVAVLMIGTVAGGAALRGRAGALPVGHTGTEPAAPPGQEPPGAPPANPLGPGDGGGPAAPHPPEKKMPKLTGSTLNEAEARLTKAGLSYSQSPPDLKPKHKYQVLVVKYQTPEEGQCIPVDGQVALTVVRRVNVPSVVGTGSGTAQNRLEAAGLKVTTVSGSYAKTGGIVQHQSVRGRVAEGTKIRLTISVERPPPPKAPPPKATPPKATPPKATPPDKPPPPA